MTGGVVTLSVEEIRQHLAGIETVLSSQPWRYLPVEDDDRGHYCSGDVYGGEGGEFLIAHHTLPTVAEFIAAAPEIAAAALAYAEQMKGYLESRNSWMAVADDRARDADLATAERDALAEVVEAARAVLDEAPPLVGTDTWVAVRNLSTLVALADVLARPTEGETP